MGAPEPVRHPGEERAVPGDESVARLGQRAESGNTAIRLEPEPVSRGLSEQTEDRFGAPEGRAVRLDQMHRLGECRCGNPGESRRDFLRGREIHVVPDGHAPPLDPALAEAARPVVHEERSCPA